MAMDVHDDRIVAVTNVGEVVVLDTLTGSILSTMVVEVSSTRVAPLSLALGPMGIAHVGIMDGQVISIDLADLTPSS